MSTQTLCRAVVQLLSCVWLLATQWTTAHQASLCSAIFPRADMHPDKWPLALLGKDWRNHTHMYLPCLSGSFLPEARSMASRSEYWLRYAHEVKDRDFGFRRPPWPHAPLFLTLILVLVIDGKQYPTHVQDRIQAKIQNDSYADLRNSFSNSLLYYNVVWKLMLPVPLGAVSVSLFPRITELCLRSGKSLLTKRSPLVPFPFHNNCRPLLLDAQCLIADISWILDSFLIAYDEKLSSNMVVLWWEEESSVFKHWHVF